MAESPAPLRDAWSQHSIQRRVLLLAGAGSIASVVLLGGIAWQGLASLEGRVAEERLRTATSAARTLDHLLGETQA
ncbi:MAG TPA: hypothetical protein VII13_11880, partial [Vicinamibacteria bacterium]